MRLLAIHRTATLLQDILATHQQQVTRRHLAILQAATLATRQQVDTRRPAAPILPAGRRQLSQILMAIQRKGRRQAILRQAPTLRQAATLTDVPQTHTALVQGMRRTEEPHARDLLRALP